MFTGCYTALITPFKENGDLDEDAFTRLINFQIESDIDGLVILGTTGESPTVSAEEHNYIIKRAVEIAHKRTKIIAGTGSNCTAEAIFYSQEAEKSGADGLLQVNPYYNKPTQKGLYQHFKAVAESVKIPIILYNIMGRTGVNLETSTLLKLAEIENIVSVKEASGNLKQIEEVIQAVPENFSVLSGDDGLTLKLCELGGHGVISVLSNILPKEMKGLVDSCNAENWTEAEKIQKKLSPLFEVCFIETNPQPIKTLLAVEGFCEEVFRLPLTTLESENRKKLLKVWETYKNH